MKDFWSENKGIIGKLVLQQFGAAFFGCSLILAASAVPSEMRLKMELFVSIIATALYMFLLYNFMWEKGGQDRIKVDGGRAERKPLKGLWIALFANIPNLLIAACVLIAYPFAEKYVWAGTTSVVARLIATFWESMYDGFVSNFAPNNPIIFLLMVFPALITCEGAYLIGLSNKRLFGFLGKKKKEK